jgi:hypothetical protein
VIEDLTKNIRRINEKIEKKIDGRLASNEEVLLGNYGSKSLKENGNISSPIQHCRYIVQVGKLYRKYTIELVNLYRVYRVALNFEKSKRRTGFKVILKSFDERGNSRIEFNKNYPEYVWEQLSICPFTE